MARSRLPERWRAEKAGEERLAEGCDGLKGRSVSTESAEQEFEHHKVRERRVSTMSARAGGVIGGWR